MSQNCQEPLKGTTETSTVVDDDSVVISGMAGLYPQARYVKDLENILYNKMNPINAENMRWSDNHPEMDKFAGRVPDLNHFDAQFFKTHAKLAVFMDAISRKMLEISYEAVYDAGVNMSSLSGKKIGVFSGVCLQETEKCQVICTSLGNGFGIVGCNASMFSNRISYMLNAKGPSYSIDQSGCGSTAALEAAYQAIKKGECEAALALGGTACFYPHASVNYGRLMPTSKDGKTKCFSKDAAGFLKTEAINCLLLQKAKYAKRIYAEVVFVKSEFLSVINEKSGPKFGFYREPALTAEFLNKFYREAGVSPAAVEYIEAFGSAVPEVDKVELETIDKVFCSEREEPLLVGSVMSNIGYGEAASGISSVTKILLGYHKGTLAGNLHCSEPRSDVAALQEGRMHILTDNKHFRRTYAAINDISVTGINGHILLRGRYKEKDLDRYKSNIPRLVTISGRQDTAVTRALDLLKSHPIDPEEIALLYNIHETHINGHLGKGYTILDINAEGKTVSLAQKAEYCDIQKRPLWFVYSGMGSQWAGMGAQLMKIPIFAAAIERCQKVLKPHGIDIIHIITSADKTIFDNILQCFVSITAMQIALTDVLQELGLVPDKMIGHSMGELGCAYADGCLTTEETILSSYSRGRVSLDTPFIRGSMVAVGVGAKEILPICPPEIEIACRNSAKSCTISGPAEVMSSFVADLTARGIFAKEVPCSSIAYHSRYIADAGPGLLKHLKEVIKTPKARSERWISSSVPQDKWNEPDAQFSSAEYHTNNLLNPVLFEDVLSMVPKDAVLVEVAPHGLMQAILKRALPDSVANVPLMHRSNNDDVFTVLNAIGQLYVLGYNPNVQILYPKVEFPVSTTTPMMSHYVEWAHQEEWPMPLYQPPTKKSSSICTFIPSILDDCYLKDHVIGNKTVLPLSFALVAAWDTLSMSQGAPKKSLDVKFRDVKLFTQPILHEQRAVKLAVTLHRGSGWFEIKNEDSKVATGFISAIEKDPKENISDFVNTITVNSTSSWLNAENVYKIFHRRGYYYSNKFQSIHSTDSSVSESIIRWDNDWVTFIDGLLQLNTLKYTDGGLSQPDRIGKMIIEPVKHAKSLVLDNESEENKSSLMHINLCDLHNATSCGGVTIENLRFRNVVQLTADNIILQSPKFVPRFDSKLDVSSALNVLLQIVAENLYRDCINVIGISLNENTELFENMKNLAKKSIPSGTKINYQCMSINTATDGNDQAFENADIVLTQNFTGHDTIFKTLYGILPSNTFVINEEKIVSEEKNVISSDIYNIVSTIKNTQTWLVLGRWRPTIVSPMTSAFTVRTESDLPLLEHMLKTSSDNGSFILTSYPPVDGLIGLVKQWRREATNNRIHVFMFNENSYDINFDNIPDLVYNVLSDGRWGGEYYLNVDETSTSNDNMSLHCDVIGDLNSLRWKPSSLPTEPGILVQVHYAGLKAIDAKRAYGFLLDKNITCSGFGMDFSGVTSSGSRVMGVTTSGSARSVVSAAPELTWPVPPHWSLEDAATVPFAYLYAYYCLVIKTSTMALPERMKIFTVLVHGGAGALGQAAISVALARGWRVFTTVADAGKKRFLAALFPELDEENIGFSRDSLFTDMVLGKTNGLGCNLVICCLKGELKQASLRCCGILGKCIDTKQTFSDEDFVLGLNYLNYDISFSTIYLKNTLCNPKSKEVERLHALVSEGISNGEVRPIARVTYAADEASRALRLLAMSRHRGRALLRLRDNISATPRFTLEECRNDANKCINMVICDSSHLGMQIQDILILSGIKKLHLLTNTSEGYLLYKKRQWETSNSDLQVTFKKIEDFNKISDVLQEIENVKPVEGLYMIADNELQENHIKEIDITVKNNCNSLRRFMVISSNGRVGHRTCVQRSKEGLPATLLDLSLLKKDHGWVCGAEVAFQKALLSVNVLLVARPEEIPYSLIQGLADYADLNICTKSVSNTTLQEMGISVEKYPLINVFLRDVYNTFIEEDDIPGLTLEKLKQIEDNSVAKPWKEVEGLGNFFSFVDSDEIRATTDIVFMRTLTNNYIMRGDECEESEKFLCIVPGLEGHHERFRALCERLKLPALVLQPGLDQPEDTPVQLAARYAQILFKKTNLKNKFNILGYETGVLVALELAAILEEDGLTGTVFCLGDGPSETTALVERSLRAFPSPAELQEAVARHMCALMAPGAAADVERALRGCSSWAESVDACVRSLLGHVPHSAQYARALLDAAYTRCDLARRAGPAAPRVLRSRVVLLRARGELPRHAACSLQRYSRREILVRELAAPMPHAAVDLTVSTIINECLDDDILRAFDNRNLCESYLFGDWFTTSIY